MERQQKSEDKKPLLAGINKTKPQHAPEKEQYTYFKPSASYSLAFVFVFI